MTIGEIFRQTYLKLKNAGIEQSHLEAGWMIEKYAKMNTMSRITNQDVEITNETVILVEQAVRRRVAGEPLAYIFGECEFFSRHFYVNKDVLIPRPETEQLVDWALDWIASNKPGQAIDILDLGTGSGCLGLTLLKEIPSANLTAVDISGEALAVAKTNAEELQVLDRVEFILLDAGKVDHLIKRFDIVVANPPYIAEGDETVEENVKKYEPSSALYSGQDGLTHIASWVKATPKILKEKSAVGFEIGAQQRESVVALFSDLNIFSKHYSLKDYSGHDRFVCGEKQ